MNVLMSHLKQSVETMLARGVSQREIARVLGVDPKTTRRIAQEVAKSRTLATGADGVPSAKASRVATDLIDDVDSNSPGVANGSSGFGVGV